MTRLDNAADEFAECMKHFVVKQSRDSARLFADECKKEKVTKERFRGTLIRQTLKKLTEHYMTGCK